MVRYLMDTIKLPTEGPELEHEWICEDEICQSEALTDADLGHPLPAMSSLLQESNDGLLKEDWEALDELDEDENENEAKQGEQSNV